ncbi:hypothetical protein Suden_1953 [Sulfurimonas denitrificans DSM 1251]|uniref:Uncharacterized protein n=1 Tax=Sulfurimonas denitrificans (strain ATCC 33889 / DSM 1251) TaxID=326298 RepID=Q30P54_SULDN|nr:hypothetical protein [Sulfurimonas denitrificans]ABB45227.1 hypothetical protein Suden_1953 [Sulfurimonas denitrificans DSM 1251]MCK9477708.1 hypothetical protein [Candidatus Muirbacterium halophilum]MDD3442020.1 hypothetical protein [Sulfurimonas denitrificans]
MTLQERKDKADIIAKKSDIIYKKMVVLLASAGAIGSYGLNQIGFEKYFLMFLFGILVVGLMFNYFSINKAKRQIEELENE